VASKNHLEGVWWVLGQFLWGSFLLHFNVHFWIFSELIVGELTRCRRKKFSIRRRWKKFLMNNFLERTYHDMHFPQGTPPKFDLYYLCLSKLAWLFKIFYHRIGTLRNFQMRRSLAPPVARSLSPEPFWKMLCAISRPPENIFWTNFWYAEVWDSNSYFSR